MGYKLNGVETEGLPVHLIKPLLDSHSIPYFVETGTAGGHSVKEASSMFKKCYTMEIISGRPVLKDVPKNIDFMIGNSIDLLPEVIDELIILREAEGTVTENGVRQQFVLFWLDAHYSDNVPNKSDIPECPVLDEIEIVSKYGDDSIVIIDDCRLFLGATPYPCNSAEWCGIDEIFNKLRTLFPYHYNTLVDDYIVSIPIHIKEVWDEQWNKRFLTRYPSEQDKLKVDAQNVYKSVLNYLK